ncbi:Uncharacterised protein [Sphingobacterium multivorum]|nr:Uncharacterised protein [Sphingobacterium multivorum]
MKLGNSLVYIFKVTDRNSCMKLEDNTSFRNFSGCTFLLLGYIKKYWIDVKQSYPRKGGQLLLVAIVKFLALRKKNVTIKLFREGI